MASFKDLFLRYMAANNLNKTEISERIDTSLAYISQLITGASKPPTHDKCVKLANIFKLADEDRRVFLEAAWLERLNDNDKVFLDDIGFVLDTNISDIELPIVTSVGANDEVGHCCFLPFKPPYNKISFKGCKVAEVTSDSMSPIAYKGQKIIYSETAPVRNGDFVFVKLQSEAQLFKRYFKDKSGNITLQSINPIAHYEPINIVDNDINEIYKVVGVWFG